MFCDLVVGLPALAGWSEVVLTRSTILFVKSLSSGFCEVLGLPVHVGFRELEKANSSHMSVTAP